MGSLMLLLVVVVLALSSTCRQSLVEFLKKMNKNIPGSDAKVHFKVQCFAELDAKFSPVFTQM